MWSSRTNKFCESLGLSVPVIQAPMAGATTPELVAAVSNAGGLGSFPAGYLAPDVLRSQLREVRVLTNRSFAVNLFVPPKGPVRAEVGEGAAEALKRAGALVGLEIEGLDLSVPDRFRGQVEVLLDEGIEIVSWTFGVLPDWALQALDAGGAQFMGTATCVAEARALEEQGCIAVVAQGAEAGGHRGSFDETDVPMVGTLALTPQIADAVRCHVVAAGGIMDGRGLAAVLALGASAAQAGTAFLTADEAGTDPAWRQRLAESTDTESVITRAFSGKAARGLANEFTRTMAPVEAEVAGYPAQNSATTALRAEARRRGNSDFLSLWAGQASPLVRTGSAGALVEALISEAADCVRRLSDEG